MLTGIPSSLSGSSDKEFAAEPQYEDIDKYDYLVKRPDETYEKMKSVQLVVPTANGVSNGHVIHGKGHMTHDQVHHSQGHMSRHGQSHVIPHNQGHMTFNQGHMIHGQGHAINPSGYDYAAVH